jgi:hypothetical protein
VVFAVRRTLESAGVEFSQYAHHRLFAGLHKQSMIFRLSEKDQPAFLKLDGAGEFEPMPGRKMKGYVILENPLARGRKELARWISRSLAYASTLNCNFPPKPPRVL